VGVAAVGAINPMLVLGGVALLPTTKKLKRSKPRIRNYAVYCSKFWTNSIIWVAEIEELRLELETSLISSSRSPTGINMKIIITASSNKIDQPFNPRFGRAEYLILFDSETHEAQAFANPAAGARGGAGPQAVQFIASHKPDVVISGRFGPKAFSALEAAGIKAYIASSGTVSEVLDQFLAGELTEVSEASGPGMHG
jgi:predicted Fe-Mo cluster-binding NifX family protein